MNVEVVVAKFNEDVSWTKNVKHKVTIYNKNREDDHLYENNLPNYGKDAQTHLYHIINNYDNLTDFTIFLQGNPFDHYCENCVEFINSYKFDKEFHPLGATYVRDNEGCIKQATDYCDKMGISYELPFMFVAGMQCIVKKETIQKNNRDFYVKLIESIRKTISLSSGPGDGNDNNIWALEYTWPTIFGVNDQLTHRLNNC